jgi:hypothetical protein
MKIYTEKFSFLLLCVFFASLVAVVFFPWLDSTLQPNSTSPGLVTVLGTGVSLSLFTVALLWYGLNYHLNFPTFFLLAVFAYNVLIVLIKFSLAPIAIYDGNTIKPYVKNFLAGDPNNPTFWLFVTVCVFLIYALVFYLMTKVFAYKSALLPTQQAPGFSWKRVFLVLSITILIAFIILTGSIGILFLPLLAVGLPTINYITVFSPSILAVLIAIGLTAGLGLVVVAFQSAQAQAKLLQNAAIVSSFFWVAMAFLAVYHFLWVVYIIILVSLWPLRVVSPSGK